MQAASPTKLRGPRRDWGLLRSLRRCKPMRPRGSADSASTVGSPGVVRPLAKDPHRRTWERARREREFDLGHNLVIDEVARIEISASS